MEHQFKIGDRVRVIDHRPHDWAKRPKWVEMMDTTYGKVGTITDLREDQLELRFDDRLLPFWYRHSWVEPFPAKEEPLLEVGDRVRLLCDTLSHSKGSIHTIERVDAADPAQPYRVGGWWCGKNQVELVGSSSDKPARESTSWIDLIQGLCGAGSPQESANKLPLINKTKLLTTIKID